MKKSILMLAAVFTFSSAFISCRDAEEGEDEVEMIEAEENIEDPEDEVNDEFDEEPMDEEGGIDEAVDTDEIGTDVREEEDVFNEEQ